MTTNQGNSIGSVSRKPSKFRLPIHLTLSQKRNLWGYIFLLIPFTYLLIVRLIPTFIALNMSFREWSILSPLKIWVGFENFTRLFGDDRFWKSLINTFTIGIISVPIVIIIGLGIALLLNRITRLRGVYRLIYFIPFMTVLPAVARVWRWAYAPEVGTFNNILQKLGLPSQSFLLTPDQALYSLILVIIWLNLGFAIVILLAGLNQVPREYYEAAEIDGANPWQVIKNITIPLLNQSFVFLTAILTISSLQTFTLVFVMIGSSGGSGGHTLGGPLDATRTLVIHIYDFGFRRLEMGYASAMTVVLLFIVLILTYLQIRVMSRRIEY